MIKLTIKDTVSKHPVLWTSVPANDVDKTECTELKELSYKDIELLNGEHLIYGIVECFEQGDNVPEWYDRDTVIYSFSYKG